MNSTSRHRASAAILVMAGIVMTGAIPASGARAQSFERVATGLTDTLQTAIDLLPKDVTSIRLGLGPVVGSKYEGSDDYKVDPVPVVSLRYKNVLEIDNNEVKLTAFNLLFSANTNMSGGTLKAGPLISLNFGRGERDSPDLAGMGNVGTSLELGGFVSYSFDNNTRVRMRARQDVISGHKGATVSADVTQAFIRGTSFALGGIVAGTWASAPYMHSYFGVTPAQAARSGYPVYTPGGDFKDITLGLNGNYQFAKQWAVVANVSYKRLLGDAAASPLVRLVGSANQMSYSTFVVYSF